MASMKENLPTQHVEELICRDVRNMMLSYKMHKKNLIEIYTLSKNYNIVMSTSLGEHDPRDNASEEVNEVIMEEHELANSTKIEQDKIDHMWDIILRKKGKQVDAFQQDVIDQFDQF
ncbi:hypothetical protein KY285_000977 [Solanum tuberosum]|nr:hypothetical protein KY285_000977 [Solanum tuberosum]